MDANVDKINFAASIGIVLLVSVPLALNPIAGAALVEASYAFVATNFGWLYLLAGVAVLLLLMWLAFGRFGKVRLGAAGEGPEFSTYSWIAMLFCAGVGAGLMYWSAIEWASYYQAPPFGVAPETPEAARWASSYGMFHWGIIAWAFYCLPTIAIAYPFYARQVPVLKYSVACHYWFRGREESAPARAMDFLFMLALIGGAGSSLGFSTPLIAALISRLTGVDTGFGLEAVVVGICVVAFAGSVFLGLEKGIKRLSDINMALALGLLAFVFIAGPTLFIVKASLSGVGTMVANFVTMSTWADPFTDSGFVEDWTVFYWAWWVAYGPFVGMFVTRISRGRTIRQVIAGMLLYGSLGGALFYMVLGNFSLALQLSGEVDILGIMQATDGNQAIVASFDQLPLPELAIGLFCIVSIIFSATTYDSASYTLASSATRSLHPSEDPPRWHRTFWAFALAILPITLMYIGGIKVAQTAVLIASLPILLTGVLSSVALVKVLREDHPQSPGDGERGPSKA
ncbi:MAG: BCCT family transporter [Congregibacter sp.]|nr:BCCT family transporter [Congregibacter sp.]